MNIISEIIECCYSFNFLWLKPRLGKDQTEKEYFTRVKHICETGASDEIKKRLSYKMTIKFIEYRIKNHDL